MPQPPRGVVDDPLLALDEAQRAFDSAPNTVSALPTQPWSRELVVSLALGVLIFTCIVLLMSTVLLWRQRATPMHVLRLFGIVTIIGVSALLLVVGYSNEQLTPIIGLFGAIAGYLLGKESSPSATGKLPPDGT